MAENTGDQHDPEQGGIVPPHILQAIKNQNGQPAGRTVTGVVPPNEDILSMLGEGVHTGLRKGSDTPGSAKLWNAIHDYDDGAWRDALEYCLWGLRYSGWEIVKVTEG